MNMKIRGSTQLLDDSIPLEKLTTELQDWLLREQKRADFVATAGQTTLSHADFGVNVKTYVYLNGVMLQPNEFSLGAGSITLTAPAELNDQITVLYEHSAMPGPVPRTLADFLPPEPYGVGTILIRPSTTTQLSTWQIGADIISDGGTSTENSITYRTWGGTSWVAASRPAGEVWRVLSVGNSGTTMLFVLVRIA